MYGLKALLVACDGQTLVDLQRELEKLSIEIEGRVQDVDVCLALASKQPGDRLLILHARSRNVDRGARASRSKSVSGRPLVILVDSPRDLSALEHLPNVEIIELPFRPDAVRPAIHRLAGCRAHKLPHAAARFSCWEPLKMSAARPSR